MNPEEQRKLVREYLSQREEIEARTRTHIDDKRGVNHPEPLSEVDPNVRREVEEQFYAELGRVRYTTSDGRTMWMTPEDAEKRKRAKKRQRQRGSRYYGPVSKIERRKVLRIVFNVGAVVLALGVVYLLMR